MKIDPKLEVDQLWTLPGERHAKRFIIGAENDAVRYHEVEGNLIFERISSTKFFHDWARRTGARPVTT